MPAEVISVLVCASDDVALSVVAEERLEAVSGSVVLFSDEDELVDCSVDCCVEVGDSEELPWDVLAKALEDVVPIGEFDDSSLVWGDVFSDSSVVTGDLESVVKESSVDRDESFT